MSQSFHPSVNALYQNPVPSPGHLNMPMIFGAVTVGLMLLCQFQRNREPLLIIGCVIFGFMAGAYGFMVGAWPLGVAQIIYTTIAVRPWLDTRHQVPRPRPR